MLMSRHVARRRETATSGSATHIPTGIGLHRTTQACREHARGATHEGPARDRVREGAGRAGARDVSTKSMAGAGSADTSNAFEDPLAGLAPGKHPTVRLIVSGSVNPDTIRVVSKRLFFFTVQSNSSTDAWECLAKWRDGCLTEEEIALLAEKLRSASHVSIHGFLEVYPEGKERSLHVMSATLSSTTADGEPPLQVPEAVREPLAEEPAPAAKRKKSGTHTRPNTEARHQQFVSWLVDTYGDELLRSGGGVLDVAGGAGGVAFELAFRRGIPCVVVDPRPMKLSSKQRRALKNRVNTQSVLWANPPPAAPSWLAGGSNGSRDSASPSLPRAGMDACGDVRGGAGGVDGARGASEDDASASNNPSPEGLVATPRVPASYAEAWAEEGLEGGCLPRQIIGLFDEDFAEGAHSELWRSVSIVVGMHPDQATEPIVRLALQHGKPFAVVPCCVFAKSNPTRRLRDGTPVVSHPEFCSWLQQLDGEPRSGSTSTSGAGMGTGTGSGEEGRVQLTEMGCLPFEGRNILVYSHGGAPLQSGRRSDGECMPCE
jgi:hypothetical protein